MPKSDPKPMIEMMMTTGESFTLALHDAGDDEVAVNLLDHEKPTATINAFSQPL